MPNHKKLNITVEAQVYKDLHKLIGSGKISPLLNALARDHLKRKAMEKYLEEGYRAMAADKAYEKEAREWCEAFIGDGLDEINDEYSNPKESV